MPMTDPRLVRWAHTLVHYCLDVQPGETVAILSTPLAEPLIREVYREALRVHAYPLPLISLPSLQNVLYEEGNEDQLRWRSPVNQIMATHADKRLSISASPNPLALALVDPARQATANQPRITPSAPTKAKNVKDDAPPAMRLVGWCNTLYPTEGYAQLAGMSLGEFEEFVFAACFLNDPEPAERWRALGREQQRYVDWLRGKQHIHVIGDDIDLHLDITGRTFKNSDGRTNFPSGEFFTGPVEDSVHGHIRFDVPSSRDGRIVRDVRLRFEGGRVVEATAGEGEYYLHSMLAIDEGATRLGEFAFGNNFGITRGIINTLYDEKIGGTIHMALGESYAETGGMNHSAIHWDFIRDLRKGGEVYVDDILFLKDGQYQQDALSR